MKLHELIEAEHHKRRERHTIEELRQNFNYCDVTGIFHLKKKRGMKDKIRPKQRVGYIDKQQYCVFNFGGIKYLAHRVAWAIHYGNWPIRQIDHINGIRSDNRITNLREATVRANSINRKRHREGNLCGANKCGNKFRARIRIGGKQINIGTFDTEQDASRAYHSRLKILQDT